MNRACASLAGGPFDLLVLGGGITGAGIAIDATLRGFRVALIDKGDFAGGTSSASSKLIHGGLRYLEHAAFGLVHEALAERRQLLRNAPHLVHPLRFVIPFYRGARLAPWQWRVGLTLYDLLAGQGNLNRSRKLTSAGLHAGLPTLRGAGLRGGAVYADAQMDDARLCLAVLRTAVRHGACVANYVEAVQFIKHDGHIVGVNAVDRTNGSSWPIRAFQVVNATGPWVDAVCRLAGDNGGPYLRPTKGVHGIVPNYPRLTDALLLLHPADGRVFFVIPWPRHPDRFGTLTSAHLLIGTTDTFAEDLPEALAVTPADIGYLLAGHNAYLGPELRPADVQGSFAGLRPLIRSAPGAPSAMSREFRVIEGADGLLSVAGGKYTTYRHMAEVVTDAVARRLGRPRRCRTRDCPLDGAPDQPWADFVRGAVKALTGSHELSEDAARHLAWRYGTRAFEAAAYLDEAPELARPIVPGEPDLLVELPYQRDHEMALTPSDHFLRRMRLGMYHPEVLRAEPAVPAPTRQS
jgi:glycerol-3-phosphate dehydrogenase